MNTGSAKWIWCDEQQPNTYCCARGALHLAATPVHGTMHVVADSRYQLWVNGTYIGQGPIPFKRPNIFVDTFDITAYLHVGKNVVSIHGNYHGVKHCTYTPGIPGILARVEGVDPHGRPVELVTDETWKARASRAYLGDVPRRTWATAWSEIYDARLEQTGWEDVAFDDSQWPHAREIEQGQVKLLPRAVRPWQSVP